MALNYVVVKADEMRRGKQELWKDREPGTCGCLLVTLLMGFTESLNIDKKLRRKETK